MDQQTAVEKIKKLLAVVKSGTHTPGEICSAASLAQNLINKFNIDSILLSEKSETIDPLQDMIVEEDVFVFEGPRILTFMLNLLGALGDTNGIKSWYRTGGNSELTKGKLQGAGRTIDLAAVRYLLAYLYSEIENQTEVFSRTQKSLVGSCSKACSNSFKLGVVSEVSYRLRAEHRKNREELLDPTIAYRKAIETNDVQKIMELDKEPKYSLAVIQNAVATLDDRKKKATEWAEGKFGGKFTKGAKRVAAKSYGAYSAGIAVGKTINLSNQNKQLT